MAEKLYEMYGVPEYPWLEERLPPDYATIMERDEDENSVFNYGISPQTYALWGAAAYWTALEAAMLISGIEPNDPEIYAVELKRYDNDNLYTFKYCREFDAASEFLFLFERSSLAPKSAPGEWLKYFNQINTVVWEKGLGFRNHCFKEWSLHFGINFGDESDANIQSQTGQLEPTFDYDKSNTGRRQQQHEIILAIIAALYFDPLNIPDGGKAKIKTACLTRPRIFTDTGFDHAWKAGLEKNLFKLENADKYKP